MQRGTDLVKRIEDFGLEYSKVGEEIRVGSQHRIFYYDEKYVIKVPRKSLFMRAIRGFPPHVIQNHINTVNKFFPMYSVPTEVFKDDFGHYIIKQKRIKGEYLTIESIRRIKSEFDSLLTINESMKKESKKSLDILGYYGWKRSIKSLLTKNKNTALISNLMIEEDKKGTFQLKIIDTNLAELERAPHLTTLHFVFDRVSVVLTDRLIDAAYTKYI